MSSSSRITPLSNGGAAYAVQKSQSASSPSTDSSRSSVLPPTPESRDSSREQSDQLVQEFEEKLELKLEGAGHEPVDCVCEAVGSNKDSVTYECKYQMGDATEKKARIQGKFAMNVPYVCK